jgi:outer membrane receptor protein involved in Fe transport
VCSSDLSQLGLFAEARRSLGARLDVRAGLRGGLSALRIAGDADTGASVTTADWAAEVGLELSLRRPWSLVGNLGRGFRAPNINDLSGLGPRPGNRYQQPADSLANEHALGGDLGVRLRHARFTAEAYAFALRHDDRIDVVPTGALTDTGRELVVSANVGTTRTHGVELSAVASPRDDVVLSASLTWVSGTKDDRGEGEEPADRIPPLGGSLSARFTPVPKLDLEGSLRFARSQRRLSARDQADPRIDPAGTDPFFVISVGARYAWSQLALAARVENLADRQYREHASGIDAPGIDARLLVHWTRDY